MAGTTTHHCPKKSKGACRRARTPARAPYCPAHQVYCKLTGCSSEYPFLATGKCKTCANRKAYEQKQKDEKKKADDKTTEDKKDREERERRENKSDAEKQSDIRQFIQDKKDAHKARFQKHKTRFEKFESSKPLTKDEKRVELVAKMNYKPSAFCLDFALFPHKFFLLDLFVCVHPLLLIRGFVFVCFYCPSSRAKVGLW